jgi:antitoxin component YwqK of YwqJK toxin-antitoxin module
MENTKNIMKMYYENGKLQSISDYVDGKFIALKKSLR